MFKKENINPKVQKALYRKIDAMDRLALKEDRVTTQGGQQGASSASEISNNKSFFIGNALEPQDRTNPIEQHLYRGTFAKVSVAVPEFADNDSDIITKPISISSYITNKEDSEKNILESIQKNTPLTFREGIGEKGENGDNLFLGHSGITSIKVDQKEFYTYQFDIGWVCPDPVYFEEVFEKSFLKFGAYISIEFGWGMNDSGIETPALTIEEMRNLLKDEGRLLERNQNSAGNYYCGVGTVVGFEWKIQESGIYAGSIKVITPGASTLLETTQGTSDSSDAMPVRRLSNTLEARQLAKDILSDLNEKNEEQRAKFLENAGVTEADLIKASQEAGQTQAKLEENSVIFNLVISNLSSVCDRYLDGRGGDLIAPGTKVKRFFRDDSTAYDDLYSARLKYKFKKGLMRIDVRKSLQKRNVARIAAKEKGNEALTAANNVPDYMKERHFATWGWFEDNILKSFFELSTADGTKLQEISSRSVKFINKNSKMSGFFGGGGIPVFFDNPCVSTEYLYSLGLDHTILPKKHNPILEKGFDIIKDDQKKLIPQFYKREQRIELDRIRLIYKAIDEEFSPFEKEEAEMLSDVDLVGVTEKDKDGNEIPTDPDNLIDERFITKTPGKGSIRNMVFPIQKFIDHFENTPSLRQGLRNFWADVSNQYGGFWSFQIGQDVNKPTRVGVFDTYYSEKNNSVTDKASSPDDPNGRFEFSVLSDKSIVKSFDVDLQLTAEAATLARYGGFSSANKGTTRIDGKKDLGLEAWNILTSATTEEDILTLEQLERFKKIKPDVVTGLQYSSRTIDFKSISTIKEDAKKIIEKVENERSQFLSGVGCYDKRGNFSQYFKQTMLYLINYADLKGTGSNIEKLQVPIPVEVSLTLDGIGGLKVGDLFDVDYLPELYRKHCYFMISNIGHSVSTAGWETTITGVMHADMPDFFKTSGKRLGAGLDDYLELFTLTNIGEVDIMNLNAFQTADVELKNVESKKAYEKVRDKIDTFTGRYATARTVPRRRLIHLRITNKRSELIKKWNKYLEVLELSGNDVFIKTETSRHEEFLFKTDKFLEDNVEDSLLTKFAEGKEARQARRRAIFQGIKDVFGRTQE
mgnify:CR=1 FL=1